MSLRLSDFRGKKTVVLYFYPKDNTKYCTVESISFRDNHATFQKAGAEVIGISSDTAQSHLEFATEHKLPFQLVSDAGGKIRKQYGVPATFGVIPGRVTFVIDKQGIIRHIFSSQFSPHYHVDEALKVLPGLS